MKRGRASRTAELVCMARALAHGTTPVAAFEDPTAMLLLPSSLRRRVERVRSFARPRWPHQHVGWAYFRRAAAMMVVRTVAIDEAVREAPSPQLVILGAGLDGRAWRMKELGDVVVFEVDHPDSQRDKRARAAALTPASRDIRFVPVDFAKDSLAEALASAGHDPSRPTTWIWEGVVMYLTPAQVEATLTVIAERSAKRSRLVATYHAPALRARMLGFVLARLGEPVRSAFTAEQMRALLARHDLSVVRDRDFPSIAAALPLGLASGVTLLRHYRIVIAERSA